MQVINKVGKLETAIEPDKEKLDKFWFLRPGSGSGLLTYQGCNVIGKDLFS